jgi:hypothetical protein
VSHAAGTGVVLRQLFRGRIWNVTPAVVVEDGPAWTALWLPPGATGKQGRGDVLGSWRLVDTTWRERPRGLLRVARVGEPRATLFDWRADGFAGWYVNLEQPMTRTRVGFDYDDLLLDLWITPEGDVRRLDEDEFARAVALGLVAPEPVLREADRAVDDFRSRRPPFDAGWEEWLPDPAWTVPTLPANWDELDDAA